MAGRKGRTLLEGVVLGLLAAVLVLVVGELLKLPPFLVTFLGVMTAALVTPFWIRRRRRTLRTLGRAD